MATIVKLGSGHWRAQIRRRQQYASRTFLQRAAAETWARDTERAFDKGIGINAVKVDHKTTFAKLIDMHIADLQDVGKAILRSKQACLDKLRFDLGDERVTNLTRERLIIFGKARAREGAGPVTLGIDIGYIKTVLTHASAVHGVAVPIEQVTLARAALARLGLVGHANERDRRPTQDEIDRLIAWHDNNLRQIIPLGRIVRFAIASAMRQDEICSLLWEDVNLDSQIAVVRNRKDPRRKAGNHQRVPLIDATGYDPIAILKEQRSATPQSERVFPYNGKSVGTAFRRACRDLKIKDLHFHDLRHEGTSRLFEAGYDIPEVSLVTGHKDWKMLKRYLNLRPEQLIKREPSRRYR